MDTDWKSLVTEQRLMRAIISAAESQARADDKRRKTAARQAAFRKRLAHEGLEQISAWVHPHQVPELMSLLAWLRKYPGFEVGPVRETATGRLRKVR